ncbi:MAG: hypothetical protein KatS3mg125_1385 [Lysobacterales bacterium]|jgi:hypothetical protein|nr:MAG: hypothetical protein KatS3mg125_1385 [Xanthomonadales bacterium]
MDAALCGEVGGTGAPYWWRLEVAILMPVEFKPLRRPRIDAEGWDVGS